MIKKSNMFSPDSFLPFFKENQKQRIFNPDVPFNLILQDLDGFGTLVALLPDMKI